jgi:hypothetical protein
VSLQSPGKPIAQGLTAEVYVWDETCILKLFRDGRSPDRVVYEARIAHAVHAAGLPVPTTVFSAATAGSGAVPSVAPYRRSRTVERTPARRAHMVAGDRGSRILPAWVRTQPEKAVEPDERMDRLTRGPSQSLWPTPYRVRGAPAFRHGSPRALFELR